MSGGRIRPRYLLAAGILLVYFAFLTKTYYWDGVLFSLDIESVKEGRIPAAALFHPNHLLYNALGYRLYSAALWVSPNMRAIYVLQAFNVVASVLAGYIVFLLARRITGLDGVAVFCWLLFDAGATWWKFSTDADAYIVPVLLLLLSALFVLSAQPRIIPAALCHAAAMLVHELAIFTYVPVLVWLLIGRRLKNAIAYCAVSGSIVMAAYWICYAHASHAVYPTLASWITSYSSDKGFTHSIDEFLKYYLASYIKLFAGGKLSLIAQFFGVVECAAFILCIVLLFWGIRAWKRKEPAPADRNRSAATFLWAWLIGYAVFLAVWDPGSAFHKLFVWPPIVLLIGIYSRTQIRALTLFAAALAAWNFAAFIYPHSHEAADPVLVLAAKVNRELPKNAIIYYRVLDADDWYLQYFAPGRLWKQLPIQSEKDAPVCLETTALVSFQGAADPKLKWELVNSSHNVRLECLKE